MSMNPNASRKARQRRRTPNSKPQLTSLPPLSQASSSSLPTMNDDMESMSSDYLSMSNPTMPPESEPANLSQNPDISGSGESASVRKLTGKYAKLQKTLQNQLTQNGTLLAFLGANADGLVLLNHAESFSMNLAGLARENDAVYRVLVYLTTSSVWLITLGELGMILLEIAQNHGFNAAKLFKRSQAATAGPQAA